LELRFRRMFVEGAVGTYSVEQIDDRECEESLQERRNTTTVGIRKTQRNPVAISPALLSTACV